MSLVLTSIALGVVPAWRGSLFGIILCSWLVAADVAASLVFAQGTVVNLLPVVGLVVLGFNLGVGAGLWMHFRANLRHAAA